MTSDGIAQLDWDRVHELAVEIVNCSANDDDDAGSRARLALFVLLDELDQKYGRKPSLLATRADYVESSEQKEWLLRLAYTESERIADTENQQLIVHSLASFYIEESPDASEATKWLATWRNLLGRAPGRNDQDKLSRLTAILTGNKTA